MLFRFQIFFIFLLFFNLSLGHEGTELKPKATLPGQEQLNFWRYMVGILILPVAGENMGILSSLTSEN